MKITIYTVKDCAFSKQEKEYLNTNKLVFEEKDLETNKDFLTEMLAISNNFAGTPVTRVEKDDGTIAILKGFTKEEFDTTFGLVSPADLSSVGSPKEEASAKAGPTGSTVPAVNDTPIPPVVETSPVIPTETVSPTPVVADNQPPVTNNETPVMNDPLKSVMDDLQAKVEPTPAVVETPPVVEQPPVVPPTPPDDAPSIPDFPAK